jgi:hypothetical protein
MSRFTFFKAFSLLIFLLINVFSNFAFAQAETLVTLKNNTDATAIFCLNDVYKSTIAPKSQTLTSIPTGSQKIDLIAINQSQSGVSCIYNYSLTDASGLPAHDDYTDIFYDYEDYFYTLNQSIQPVTTSTITYQVAPPVGSLGVTGIDLSAILPASGFSNTQLCVDGLIAPATSANFVSVPAGSHSLLLVSTASSGCSTTSSAINLTFVVDNTYKYTIVTNNTSSIRTTYQAVADFKAKPQQQSIPPVQAPPAIPPQDTKEETKKETLNDEKTEDKKPVLDQQIEKPIELIKYDKLTIERASKDKIEDTLTPADNQNPASAQSSISTENQTDWKPIIIITTLLYIFYDLAIYLWKKSNSSIRQMQN